MKTPTDKPPIDQTKPENVNAKQEIDATNSTNEADKKHEEDKPKLGRPRFNIDFKLVKRLAKIHCTQQEIADSLGCSTDTLVRSDIFCDIYKKAIAEGKMSLRRLQWKAAVAGNNTMLIWLGKQNLGQRDVVESYDNRIPIPLNIIVTSSEEKKTSNNKG